MPHGLDDATLPDVFRSADTASLRGQTRYVRSSVLRLVAVIGAATFAAFTIQVSPDLDLAAILVALFFVAALIVEFWQKEDRPATEWYDGRALAESTKTLSWRYAVRAAPFDGTDDTAREKFRRSLQAITEELGDLAVTVGEGPMITPAMDALRGLGLEERKATYLASRVRDQQHWYSTKADLNRRSARRWRTTLLALEFVGVVIALLKAFGVVGIDLPGIVAATIGAGAAWLALRQHDSNARAYALAAAELAQARAALESVTTETVWATEVADAEEAISREHTMWRASRSSPALLRTLIAGEKERPAGS